MKKKVEIDLFGKVRKKAFFSPFFPPFFKKSEKKVECNVGKKDEKKKVAEKVEKKVAGKVEYKRLETRFRERFLGRLLPHGFFLFHGLRKKNFFSSSFFFLSFFLCSSHSSPHHPRFSNSSRISMESDQRGKALLLSEKDSNSEFPEKIRMFCYDICRFQKVGAKHYFSHSAWKSHFNTKKHQENFDSEYQAYLQRHGQHQQPPEQEMDIDQPAQPAQPTESGMDVVPAQIPDHLTRSPANEFVHEDQDFLMQVTEHEPLSPCSFMNQMANHHPELIILPMESFQAPPNPPSGPPSPPPIPPVDPPRPNIQPAFSMHFSTMEE